MRFTDIDIRYEGHQYCPKILSINILKVFSDHHLWCQNWCQYLQTSLCQFNFFVNLLHSLGVWIFDNLTSFWQLDIFLTTWHLFDILAHYLNHLSSSLARGQGGVKGYTWPSMPHTPVPIAHVSCTPLPHMHIPLYPIPPVPYCPMWPTLPVPIAYVSCTPYPCTLLPHMPYYPYPCTPYPLYPIVPYAPLPMWPMPMCSHCPYGPYPLYLIVPYAPLPMWPIPPVPIAHVAHTPHHMYPHYPCDLYPLYPIPLLCYCPITPVPHWAMGHMGNEGNVVQGVWVTWAMGPMSNGDTGQWGTGV